ncbi:MAG: hypothetical protein HY876_09460 [Coriobacteriales bacterium]|nr:hypothetical protein [Coriobacteriales bacterium]
MRRFAALLAVALACSLAIPQLALAFEKETVDGVAPPEYDLPKESLGFTEDPDAQPRLGDAPPDRMEAQGGTGDGRNNLSFAKFSTGDYCCAFSNAIGHAGLFDADLFGGNVYNKCMHSANTRPVNGVQLEAPMKYRQFDRAFGVWVPRAGRSKRVSARNFCKAQRGEPYDIRSTKSDYSRWYCSKLVWAAYRSVGYNLDPSGGFWVTPSDLYKDGDAAVFAKGSSVPAGGGLRRGRPPT